MYKIIGADRREYGPVHADQILKWIAEGRANNLTRTRTEESAEWRGLAEFPEFREALAARATPPIVPPLKVTLRSPEPACAAFAIGDCFSRAWALYQSNFWLLFGATAVILVLSIGLGSIQGVGWLAEAALGFALWGGLHYLFLKVIRGQTADVGDAFAGFKATFIPLLLGSLLAHVLTTVGFFLLILPGIYLLVAWWMFTPLLIIDRKLDFWPAMELGRKTVNRNWWPCFGLFLLSVLVAFGGVLVCGVGLFFTLPIALVAIVCAYEKLFGQQPDQTQAGIATPVGPGPAAEATATAPPVTATSVPPPTAASPEPEAPPPPLVDSLNTGPVQAPTAPDPNANPPESSSTRQPG